MKEESIRCAVLHRPIWQLNKRVLQKINIWKDFSNLKNPTSKQHTLLFPPPCALRFCSNPSLVYSLSLQPSHPCPISLSFSASFPFIFFAIYCFPPPQIYLCGPTSPLNSNSAHKQTALHAVITNPKLPDIKRATFHPTTQKQKEWEKKKSWERQCLSLLHSTDAASSIRFLKCDWEERQITMEEERIFEGFHIALCWSKCFVAFVANCGDYL